MSEQIGRVVGMEDRPNTAYTFYFWTNTKAKVGIGTLVRVESEDVTVYGAVVEAHGFNDLESPLHEFLSIGGDPGRKPPTERPEMRLFEAAVLRREPDEPIGATPIGAVYLADEQGVRLALRTDSFAEKFGITCGAYGSKDEPIAVHLDSRFLLGPEAGHLNMTGSSGLAAKTSYILFLLKAIFAQYRDEEDAGGDPGVAALLFNTKGGDLLYIDRDPQADLGKDQIDELDRALYSACRIDPGPFEKVRYFAPLASDGFNLQTLRRNDELEEGNPTSPFTFGLTDVLKHAEVLLDKDDLDVKADAYLQYLNDRFVEGDGHQIGKAGEKVKARTLSELVKIIQAHREYAESKNETTYETHNVATITKMLNRIRNFSTRYGGLIAENGMESGPFDRPFEPGTITVVDVSKLGLKEQDLVFAAFIDKLRDRMESNKLGVGRLVVMVDELNKYAPSGGAENYVALAMREIAARGRYLGLTLFGAQQFRSRVDKEIVGNAATHAFGHVESEELAQPGYGHFSQAVKEKLRTLSPGEVLIKHPHFAQPIFVRFPKPVIVKGGDGMKRFPQAEPRSLEDLIHGRLRELGVGPEGSSILATRSKETGEQTRTLRALRGASSGQEALEALRKTKIVPMRSETAHVAIADIDDPFAD